MSDIDARIGDRLHQLTVLYERERQGLIEQELQQMLRDRLLESEAAERGVTADDLLREELNAALDDGSSPAAGPRDAPVTLVEFSDFECPFCARLAEPVRRLEREFGDSLRIVYRQFPLENIHPDAFKAAEASLCAHEQGRFWQMHDLMFEEQNRLDIDALEEKARRLKLDAKTFDDCLETGRYAHRVRQDLEVGRSLGVNSTPTIFINGVRQPGGAVPYETLAAAVDRVMNRSTEDQHASRIDRANPLVDSLIIRLWRKNDVDYRLDPFRVELNNEGAPALGPADAPVTLVEFSDFECPFCRRFHPVLERLSDSYGDQLRIVYRQFPISSIHLHAFDAAEASLCAHDQGQFWPMHDLLFEEQERLDDESLKERADRLGLDRAAFDDCLETGKHADTIQGDLREGRRVGVEGTPALFVNGIFVGGAVPYETVAAAIDEELRRQAR